MEINYKELRKIKPYRRWGLVNAIFYFLAILAFGLSFLGFFIQFNGLKYLFVAHRFEPHTAKVDFVKRILHRTSRTRDEYYVGRFYIQGDTCFTEIGKTEEEALRTLGEDSIVYVFYRDENISLINGRRFNNEKDYSIINREPHEMSFSIWRPIKYYLKVFSIYHLPFWIFIIVHIFLDRKLSNFEKRWMKVHSRLSD